METDNDLLIKKHYKEVAEKHGSSPLSTMEDEIIRQREQNIIYGFINNESKNRTDKLRILDLGCGNGYMLDGLSTAITGNEYFGLDYSEDLLKIAQNRCSASINIKQGDSRNLPYPDDYFDIIYTERCLINVMDPDGQLKSMKEINRILKPSGTYLMIECFTDALDNINKARSECGLDNISQPYHNKFINKNSLFQEISSIFSIIPDGEIDIEYDGTRLCSNFLSSYYFASRFLYPLTTKNEVVRNTEFVKYFSFIQPIGNYSPIQAYILRKK